MHRWYQDWVAFIDQNAAPEADRPAEVKEVHVLATLSAATLLDMSKARCTRHWSTPRFSSVWQDTLSVLVARGRARVSVSASAADWPKRIRDMQYVDHDDFAVAH